jgi:hypothetical protein
MDFHVWKCAIETFAFTLNITCSSHFPATLAIRQGHETIFYQRYFRIVRSHVQTKSLKMWSWIPLVFSFGH